MNELKFEDVNKALDDVRPYLRTDGGDVELLDLEFDDEKKIWFVYVKFLGSCIGCPLRQMTLRAGVERSLSRDLNVKLRVEEVN